MVHHRRDKTWDALLCCILDAAAYIKDNHNELMRATCTIHRWIKMCKRQQVVILNSVHSTVTVKNWIEVLDWKWPQLQAPKVMIVHCYSLYISWLIQVQMISSPLCLYYRTQKIVTITYLIPDCLPVFQSAPH